MASRWADIVATLGDLDGSRADDAGRDASRTGGPEGADGADEGDGDADGPGKTAESSQTSRPDDETGGAGGGAGGRRVGGWSEGGWAAGDWTVAGATSEPDAAARPRPSGSGPRDWPLSPEAEALEEAESHFTPPEPPPLLSRDPLLTMAWSFVVGVPVLAVIGMILAAAIPALEIPPLVGQIGIGLFVAGLGVLIWRMPHQRDPDDDGPGAVV
nr:hypothetical protein GCM10025730_50490 [Promicromonospora thailandica]